MTNTPEHDPRQNVIELLVRSRDQIMDAFKPHLGTIESTISALQNALELIIQLAALVRQERRSKDPSRVYQEYLFVTDKLTRLMADVETYVEALYVAWKEIMGRVDKTIESDPRYVRAVADYDAWPDSSLN